MYKILQIFPMNKLKLFLNGLFFLYLGILPPLLAQTTAIKRCMTMEAHEQRLLKKTSLESLGELENWLQKKIERKYLMNKKQQSVIYTIPIIVHVIHNGESIGTGNNISQAQIYSQIEVLNEDFRRQSGTLGFNTHPDGADIEIEFCLAQVDEAGVELAEAGINRIDRNDKGFAAPPYSFFSDYIDDVIKPATVWDANQYLNIWTLSFSGGILGYAQFPESNLGGLENTAQSALTDGVVIDYRYFGRVGELGDFYDLGRTTTHEVGHWLGLRHIWGDGDCDEDDFCTDTPAASSSTNGCPSSKSTCGTPDMIENYMDYSYDACLNIFTQCQKTRMRTILENSPRRASLLNSIVCSTPDSPPIAQFQSDITVGCVNTTIQFTDQSSFSPTNWLWTFEGGTPSTATETNPIVSYANSGTYAVSLKVSNAFGADELVKTNYITIGANQEEVFFIEDFESNSFSTNNWTIEDEPNISPYKFEISQVAGNTGGFAARVNLYDNEAVGDRDGLISRTIDFSTHDNIKLNLYHAHRRYSQNEQDSLIIYLSTDDGQTFPHRLFAAAEDGTGTLATNFISEGFFIPTVADDWCFAGEVGSCISLDLSAFDGEKNVRLKFETYNDYGNNIYIDDITISGTCKELNKDLLLKAKVWLQGGYDANVGSMQTDLLGLLPDTHPYTAPPWLTPAGINLSDNITSAVDWVQVELRKESEIATIVAKKVGVLLSDGRIVDPTGEVDGLLFSQLSTTENYQIVIRHRNHLDIIGSQVITATEVVNYDFTKMENVIEGDKQLVVLDNDTYGMRAGDFDGDGTITVGDLNIYYNQIATLDEYTASDCNLDRSVTVSDFNLFLQNAGTIGLNAIRYE